MTRWFGISLIAHIGMAGLLLVAGPLMPQPKPIMIDLTITSPAGASEPSVAPKAAPVAAKPAPLPSPSRSRPENLVQAGPTPLPVPPHSRVDSAEKAATQSQTVTPAVHRTAPSAGSPSVPGAQTGGRAESAASTGVPAASGTVPAGSGAATQAQQRYRSQHFTYIRDQIIKHLVYPQLARRRGWSGRVLLSFVVTEDGMVRSVLIKEGSGHAVLDNSALETVKNAAPFPRPPVAAEITMPVVFRLE